MRDDFNPDWRSAPGETICDLIEERGMSLAQLAEGLCVTLDSATELLTGQLPLSADLAIRLESLFGASAAFWMKREAHFREPVPPRDYVQDVRALLEMGALMVDAATLRGVLAELDGASERVGQLRARLETAESARDVMAWEALALSKGAADADVSLAEARRQLRAEQDAARRVVTRLHEALGGDYTDSYLDEACERLRAVAKGE